MDYFIFLFPYYIKFICNFLLIQKLDGKVKIYQNVRKESSFFKRVFFYTFLMVMAEEIQLLVYPTNKKDFPELSNLIKKFLLSIHIKGISSDHDYSKNPNNAIGVYPKFTPDIRLFIGGLIV